jgi:lipopolysaccharide export system protein LptA
VNVTSNRLDYDGAASKSTYVGDARLFQGRTSVQADTIVLDDKNANLDARGHVRSIMFFEETDTKTKKTRLVETDATGDTLFYEDTKRLATYTTGPTAKAHIVGTEGDLTGDVIKLFMKEGANELERAESDGHVTVKIENRTVTGEHLTYTTADETYIMVGSPVVIEERTPECRVSDAARVTFKRDSEVMTADNNGISPVKFRQCTAK